MDTIAHINQEVIDCVESLDEAQEFILKIVKESESKIDTGFRLGLLATHLKDIAEELKVVSTRLSLTNP